MAKPPAGGSANAGWGLWLAAAVHVVLVGAAVAVVWWAIGRAGQGPVDPVAWDAPEPAGMAATLAVRDEPGDRVAPAIPSAQIARESRTPVEQPEPAAAEMNLADDATSGVETVAPVSRTAQDGNALETTSSPSQSDLRPEVISRVVTLPETGKEDRVFDEVTFEVPPEGDAAVMEVGATHDDAVFIEPGSESDHGIEWSDPHHDEQAALMTGQVQVEPSQPLVEIDVPEEIAVPAEREPVATNTTPNPSPSVAAPGAFFGMPAGQRSVYLIDASGSLIDTLPFAIEEVRRSVLTLEPEQAYAVVFFAGDNVFEAPPMGLQPADPVSTERTAAWLDPALQNVHAAGRTDAVRALAHALSYEPDTVFLLSDGITGLHDPDGDRRRLVDLIKRLKQSSRFHTVQFIDPDPTAAPGRMGTLELLATLTGGQHRFVGIDQIRPGPLTSP